MPKIIGVDRRFQGWSDFVDLEVRLDDGAVIRRQVEDHGCGASVLAYDPQRRTALVVQLFRAPMLYAGVDAPSLEPVAGIVDPGETAETTARREALEEAGVRLDALEPVAVTWMGPGFTTERLSLFLAPYALADRVGPGGGLEAEHENITVLELGLGELERRLTEGGVVDMKLLFLVQALRLRRPDLFD